MEVHMGSVHASVSSALMDPAASGAALVHPHQPEQGEHHGQRRLFVEDILPLLTSLSLHAGILIVGVLTYQAISLARQNPPATQVVPANLDVSEHGVPGVLGMSEDKPWARTQQDKSVSDTDPAGTSFTHGTARPDLGEAAGGASDSAYSTIGAGASVALGIGQRGIGSQGNGQNAGTGDGGSLAPFGAAQIGGVRNPIFGQDPARRIAFVCDASGSMLNKMASLKLELNKKIQSLRVIQSFSVIFFQEPRYTALGEQLLSATPANKRKAGVFLEGATATGSTDPIPGIQAAFRQQPQLIYLLTDGDFPDNAAVLRTIRELNKDHKVRVNTIAFVGSSDTDTAFLDLLKTIAQENGGTFRHVREEELE